MSPDALPETLLSRIEDAGINASAPPQQRWVDGWLVRCSPGKAKRARLALPGDRRTSQPSTQRCCGGALALRPASSMRDSR